MAKNIIVCCDGTNNKFEKHNTNVVRLFQCVVTDDTQAAYYDPGVGTFSVFGRWLGRYVGQLLGFAFGYGVQKNIEDAYGYLMETYEEGDRVFLFGFSRGAFTVRALAGMLDKCGLLERDSDNLIPYASRIYNDGDNREVAETFKESFCRECTPYMIGVWDTVGSLGALYSWHRFFDSKLSEKIPFGYHAVAVDERRGRFAVSLWDETQATAQQHIEQVWFPGVHSDVGGGYAETGLSDIALEWMLTKAREHGVKLYEDRARSVRPDPAGMMHVSYKGKWYLLTLPQQREIPPGARIHNSVLERRDAVADYQPSLPQHYTLA